MKVISSKDKISVIVFEKIDININDYIKRIILRLKQKYNFDIFGFYEVNVYKNKKIGTIIDFIKEDTSLLFSDLLDLNINIKENEEVYLKFADYIFSKQENVNIFDTSYYLNVNEISYKKFLNLVEFSSFIYGDELLELKNKCERVS